jgi:hypothetical protein
MGWQIATSLALSAVLASGALGAPTKGSPPVLGSALVNTQTHTPEYLEQKAREAQEKVERNRRCRPSSEKAYALAVDGCRKRFAPEPAEELRRCFDEARGEYFRRLAKCSG